MRIEAVTVCIGYGDFLRETARHNLPMLDDLVVITGPDDHETRGVCKELSIRHVLSRDHLRNGDPFNKARLINRAFDQLAAQDWVLHLDADIVLPRSFRRYLDWAHLDPEGLYGIDRLDVTGYEAWARIRDSGGWDHHRYGCVQSSAQMGLTIKGRHVPQLHGYTPIGFFQLFHGSSLIDRGYHLRRYPVGHGDAARTDVQFALQWDRRQRHLIPEVLGLHLESEPAANGANWQGRTTARFGPAAAVSAPAPYGTIKETV
jgi:hypothetical protein